MALISQSTYVAPFLFGNAHLQTVFPVLFRRVRGVHYRRERISTPDEDFLDLDWSAVGSERLVILSHGLEGDSRRSYVLGMVRAFNRHGWDALAWNMRGCSGEPNRKLRFYHSGATEDLHTVIEQVIAHYAYGTIVLVGFSLGGNVTLKYLGERGDRVNPLISGAVAFSVPCDLADSAEQTDRLRNRIYMIRFLRMLHRKIRAKMVLMPDEISDTGYHLIKTFRDFDERYTAPMHGFENAEDYWRRASCKGLLPTIAIPALLVNARNDPFLGERCYPRREAERSANLFLEMPASGGHVGFVAFNRNGEYWSESRALSFLNALPRSQNRWAGNRPPN
jgi:predicted alpha/beta-fold hydrolase